MSELQLINGEFVPEEAREVLMNIFTDKIRFHEKKCLSSLVTLSKKDDTSEKRILELKENINKLLSIIDSAKESGKLLKISSEIKIEIV